MFSITKGSGDVSLEPQSHAKTGYPVDDFLSDSDSLILSGAERATPLLTPEGGLNCMVLARTAGDPR
jgi:hypothetical protein